MRNSLMTRVAVYGMVMTATIALHGASTALAAGSHSGLEVLTPANFNTPGLVHDSWHVLGSRPTIELFINQPRTNQPAGTYDLANLPLQYRVQYGVCNNAPSAARVIGRFDQTGGVCRTSFDSNANWSVVHNQTYNNQSAIAGTNVGGYWLSEGSFNGNVNISGVSPTADKTTFQLYATWAPDAGHFSVYGEDHFLQYRRIHAVNFCININRQPICGNSKVETGEQCDDGNQNNTDSCTNQCKTAVCGDNIVRTDGHEQCDDGNQNNNDRCNSQCRLTICGDGIVQAPNGNGGQEQCDDGNTNNADSCNNQCQAVQQGSPLLQVQKSVAQTSVRGQNVTYTFMAKNMGTAVASNVYVYDAFYTSATPTTRIVFPVTYVSSSISCNFVDPNTKTLLGCSVGNLNPGDVKTFTVTLSIPTTVACNSTLYNTADIAEAGKGSVDWDSAQTTVTCPASCGNGIVESGEQCDDGNQNNADTCNNSCQIVNQTTDLKLEKIVYNPSVTEKGTRVTFILRVTNLTSVDAANVRVADPVPAGITFDPSAQHSSSFCSVANNQVTCDMGAVLGNSTRDAVVSFLIPTTYQPGVCPASVQNTATVSTSTTETSLQNNTASATQSVRCPSASCGNGTVETGEQCDDGNQSNADACNNSCQKTFCQDGIKQTPNGNGQNEQCDDGNSNNNDSCSNACTINNSTPTLDIEKDDFVTLVDRGQTVVYQIVARNTSSTSASNVTVVDVLPSKLTFVSASDSGSNNNGTVTWNLGTLAAGASRTVTLTATVNQSANDSENLTNNVDIRLNNVVMDTDQDVDTVRSDTCAGSSCTFTISKTDHESEVEPGDELTYEIRVKNTSNLTISNVTVTDELPSDVEFDDCSHDCDEDDGDVEWDNLTFGPGEEKIFKIDVTVDDNAEDGDELRNEARVRQSSYNINKTATDTTDIEEDNKKRKSNDDDIDVELTKQASTSEVFPGGIIEYRVTIENTGDSDIQDLTLTDRLPSGITILDDGDADERSGNSSLTWEIDQLDEGDSMTFTYTVSTDINAFPGTLLVNEVTLTDEDDDINERASSTVYIIGDLPQTGAATRNRYGSQHLKPMASSSDSSAAAAIAWTSIVTTLAGAGFGAYRKFVA